MKNINLNKKILAVSIAAALGSMNVQAANTAPYGGVFNVGSGDNNFILFGDHTEPAKKGTITTAPANVGKINSSLVIGNGQIRADAKPIRDFEQSIAIGLGGTVVAAPQAIAIGGDTEALGFASIVIGGDDTDVVYDKKVNVTYSNPDYNGKNKEKLTTNINDAFHNLTGQYVGGDKVENPTEWAKGNSTREWQVENDRSLGLETYEHRFQKSTAEHLGVVIGAKSVAGVLSLGLGTAARAEKTNTIAIGAGAIADRDNAAAIGGGSTTRQAGTKQSGVDLASMKFRWAGGDRVLEGDIVSFGSENYERQLKHVAPGEVSETSTDAINGSQLWSITRDIVDRIDVPNSIKTTVRTDDGKDTTNTATQVYVLTLDQDATEKARLTAEESTKLAHELKEKDPTLTDEQLKELLAEAGNATIISDRVQNRYAGRFATAHNVADMINAAGFSAAIGNDTSDFTDQNYVDSTGNKLTEAAAINAGDAVKFNSGKNLRIQQKVTAATDTTPEQIEFTYALSDQIDLGDKGTITLGGTTTKEDGKDPVTKGAITLGKDGINAGDKVISGVKDGVDGKDAVNVDQLKEAVKAGEIVKDGTNVKYELSQVEKDRIKAAEEQKVRDAETAKVEAAERERITKDAANANKTPAEINALVEKAVKDKAAEIEAKVTEQATDIQTATDKAIENREQNQLATAKNVSEMIKHATERGSIIPDATNIGKVTAGLTDEQKAKVEEAAKQAAQKAGITDTAALEKAAKDALTAAETANKEKLASVSNVADMINAAGFTTTIGTKDIASTDKTSVIDADGNAIADVTKQKSTINAGDNVKFNAGQNLRIEQKIIDDTNVEFTYALAKDVDLGKDGSLTIGGTRKADGTLADGAKDAVVIGKDGINAGNKTISGVKAGEKDTDAVNVSQLKALENKVGADTERGEIEKDGTGVKFKSLSDADKQQIKDAETAKVEAAERKRLADEYKNADPMADDSAVKAYVDGKITEAMAAKDADIQTATDKAVETREQNQLATAKNVSEMINHATDRGSIIKDADKPGKVKSGLGDRETDEVKLKAVIDALKKEPENAGKSDADLNTLAEQKLGDTNDNKYKIIANQAVKAAEIENGKKLTTVSNVAEMINAAGFNATIGNDTKDFTDQNGKADASINAGDDVIFQSGKNLKVKQEITTVDGKDTVKFTYALSDQIDLGDKGTIKLGGTTTKGADGKPVTTDAITLGKDGINAGNKTISGVKDGVDGKDAVNVDQLKEATDTGEITKDGNKVAFKLTQDEKDEIVKEELRKVIAEESAKIPAPADNASDAEKQAYQDKVKAAVEARRDEMVENAKKAVEAKENSKLATAKNVAEMINSAGFTTTIGKKDIASTDKTSVIDADGNAIADVTKQKSTINAGDNVKFNAGQNLRIEQKIIDDTNVEFTYALAKDVDLGKDGSLTIGGTRDANSKAKDAVVINSDGINAGNKTISGVKAGEKDTDAVNVSQLKALKNKVGENTERGEIEKDGTGVKFELGKAEKEGIIQAEIDRVVVEIKKENPAATEEEIKAAVEAKTAEMESNIKNAITAKENAKLATAKNVSEMINHATERGSIIPDAVNTGKVTAGLTDEQKQSISDKVKADNAGKTEAEIKALTKAALEKANEVNQSKLASVGNVADMINAAGFTTNVAHDDADFVDVKGQTKGADGKAKSTTTINAGDDVIFQSGKNLKVKQEITTVDGKDTVKFTYALSDKIDLGANGEIVVGGTKEEKQNPDGTKTMVPKDAVVIGKDGINAGNKTISGVKAGEKDTDAVNVSQLKDVVAANTEKGSIIKDATNLGKVKSGLGDRESDEVKLKAVIDALKKEPENAGKSDEQINELAEQKLGDTNDNPYKVIANQAVKAAEIENGKKLTTVGNVADMINAAGFNTKVGKADIEGADKVVDKTNGKGAAVNAGDEVTFNAGQNLRIQQKVTAATDTTPEKVEFTYALAKDVDLGKDGSLTIGGTRDANGKAKDAVVINSDGINAGNKTISGVKDGVDGKDAVNVDQLKAVEDKIVAINGEIEKGAIETDGTGVKFKPLSDADKQQIKDAETAKAEAAERQRLADEYKATNPMATDSAVQAYVDGKIADAMTTKAADIQTATDTAIEKREQNQLATAKNVAEMINHATERGLIIPDAVNTGKVTAGLTDEQKAKVQEAAKQAAQKAGVTDAATLEKAAKDAVTAAETANTEKLASVGNVADMINAAGFNATIGNDTKDFTDQKGKADASINAGDDVIFQSGKNLKVKQEVATANGKDTVKFTYALAKDVDLGKDGSLTIGGTRDTDGKLVNGAKDAVMINSDGINAGNKQIKGVAAGTDDTDAVNVSQLKALENKVGADTERGTIEKDAANFGAVKVADLTEAQKQQAKIDAVAKELAKQAGNENKTEAELKALAKAALDKPEYKAVTEKAVADAAAKNPQKLASVGNVAEMVNYATERGSIEAAKGTDGVATGKVGVTPLTDAQKAAITDAIKAGNAGKTDEQIKALADNVIAAAETANKAKLASVGNVADMINAAGFNTTIGEKDIASTDKTSVIDGTGAAITDAAKQKSTINAGDNVKFNAGQNLRIEQKIVDDNNVEFTYALAKDVKLEDGSLTIGKTVTENAGTPQETQKVVSAVTINSDGIDVGGVTVKSDGINANNQKIINVAAGEKPTDAVNVSQLNAVSNNVANIAGQVTNLDNKVQKLDDSLRGLGASASAQAALPQVYLPGKSLVAAAVGGYKGASAIAVGYSSTSDNGRIILKLQGSANTSGDLSGGAGVGYLW